MRWLVNKERALLETDNVFGEKVDWEEFNRVKFDALVREYEKNRLLLALKGTPLSVKELAQLTTMTPREVVRNLIAMEENGLVTVSEIEGVTPKYRLMGR
jgi:DNA-binding transcriptional ArsR family regulator